MEEAENHPALTQVPNFSEWATMTTEIMELGIVSSIEHNKPSEILLFQPEFTYPIFGSHETAFGYKDLTIKILFAAGSLRTYLNIDYSSKYQQSSSSKCGDSTVSADDLFGALKKHMAPDTTTNYDTFLQGVQQDITSFTPLGEKVYEYQLENDHGEEEVFEIYKCSLNYPKFREYHRRMQFFVLLFIEGSSYIEEDDEKWEIYTLYQKEKSSDSYIYTFIGYSSAYPFYCWPEQIRMRISQFLILPPYQNRGHGHQLYQTIYEIFSKRSDVCEITVEDPNESFSDLRDKCDLRYLQEHDAFKDINLPIPQDTIQYLQKQFKLTNRQINGCVEMYLLSKLNKLDKELYKSFRLQVKQRLFKFNYDTLQELEPDVRKEKLHETYCSVEQDYHRLLERL